MPGDTFNAAAAGQQFQQKKENCINFISSFWKYLIKDKEIWNMWKRKGKWFDDWNEMNKLHELNWNGRTNQNQTKTKRTDDDDDDDKIWK